MDNRTDKTREEERRIITAGNVLFDFNGMELGFVDSAGMIVQDGRFMAALTSDSAGSFFDRALEDLSLPANFCPLDDKQNAEKLPVGLENDENVREYLSASEREYRLISAGFLIPKQGFLCKRNTFTAYAFYINTFESPRGGVVLTGILHTNKVNFKSRPARFLSFSKSGLRYGAI
ncbi:hypothetical protein [Veillonella denticariosi]|jgi:hypothetical protein|uniref:hypothetical protein n=1 Tax=Veillonella denticariosi TaxID=419208 RepID=UPI0024907CA3|nr:hypothetical protein [Veillonella denticariosi]